MQLLFLDESGTPPRSAERDGKYFVLAGLIVPEHAWHPLRDAVHGMKVRRRLRGEFKWRFFAPENDDERNPMRRLSREQRDEIRMELCRIIVADRSLRVIACGL